MVIKRGIFQDRRLNFEGATTQYMLGLKTVQ